MSDTENRKSMDDVLASIRRIVRAEKDPETLQDAQVIQETAMTMEPVVAEVVEESVPLELTPDMRMSPEEPEEAISSVDVVEPVEPVAPVAMDAPSDVPSEEAAEFDPDMIRDMVRDVVMEQLAGADGDKLIRDVIRNELTAGEIGANISKNVLRLIQSEVGKALAK